MDNQILMEPGPRPGVSASARSGQVIQPYEFICFLWVPLKKQPLGF